MDEKIRIMVDAAILMENSFDGRQVCASDLLPLARLAGPLAREVERLTAELEEARLTLAAEQGRAEGAPSEGWTCERIHRGRPTWLRRAIIQGYDGTFYVEYAPIGIDGWFWCFQSADVQTAFQPADTARAAMLAADAAK